VSSLVRRTLIAAVVLTLAAALTGSAFASSGQRMQVNPLATPAGNIDPAYGLFGCQVGLSTGQCYDPYQMRKAYGVDSLIAAGNPSSSSTLSRIRASGPRTTRFTACRR
jgi:hypothetical protein